MTQAIIDQLIVGGMRVTFSLALTLTTMNILNIIGMLSMGEILSLSKQKRITIAIVVPWVVFFILAT